MGKIYIVYIPNVILKSMAKIPIQWRVRIDQVIEKLRYNPYIGKKMGGALGDRRKIRVHPYRVMYTIKESIAYITIVEVEHRGSVSYD